MSFVIAKKMDHSGNNFTSAVNSALPNSTGFSKFENKKLIRSDSTFASTSSVFTSSASSFEMDHSNSNFNTLNSSAPPNITVASEPKDTKAFTSGPTSFIFTRPTSFSEMDNSNYNFAFIDSPSPPNPTVVSETKYTKVIPTSPTASSAPFTDHSGYNFTFLPSSAPQNMTGVSELKDINVITSGFTASAKTPSASTFSSKSLIFTFYNPTAATNTSAEAQAPPTAPLTRHAMSGPA